MDKRTHNILKVYWQATEGEIRQGLSWYHDAHSAASELHPDIRVATAIVAALSPGLRWERNIEAARRLINGDSLDGLGIRYTANPAKAWRILAGEDPRVVLGGNKVRAFWHCILNPKDWFHVCVDGHAFGIWQGKRVPLDEVPNLARRGLYQKISMAYVRAADTLGILPMQLQAITWVAWRRIHGVANGGNGHLTQE